MKYEGYKIGPVIRDIRKDKGLLIEEVAAKTGISVSTLGQVEQGGRNLSMKNLYMLMEVYETDANEEFARARVFTSIYNDELARLKEEYGEKAKGNVSYSKIKVDISAERSKEKNNNEGNTIDLQI